MDDGAFDPGMLFGPFALAGLFRGWLEIYEPERDWYRAARMQSFVRLYGLMMIAALAIGCAFEGVAFASFLHFVVKSLGAYHGCRLFAWGVTWVLAARGWISPKVRE